MPLSTSTLNRASREADKILGTSIKNIRNAESTDYIRRESLSTLKYHESGATWTTSKEIRINTEAYLDQLSQIRSEAIGSKIRRDCITRFEKFFNPSRDVSESSNVQKFQNPECISNLVSQLQIALKSSKNDSSPFSQEQLASKYKAIASKVNQASIEFEEAFLEAVSELDKQISSVNDLLGQIKNLNTKIKNTLNSDIFHDERDILVKELSNFIDIKMSFSQNGVVSITSKGRILVDEDSVGKIEIDNHIGALKDFTKAKNKISFKVIDNRGNVNTGVSFASGIIGGTAAIISEDLPNLSSNLNMYAHNISKSINKAHSYACPVKGVKELIGNTKVKYGGVLGDNLGKAMIASVDDQGRAISSSINNQKILPRELDLNKFATVKDAIKYSKDQLYTSLLGTHINIGGLTNVRITDTLVNGNDFTFNLEFENSDNLDKKISILEMDAASFGQPFIPIDSLANVIDLNAGSIGATNSNATLRFDPLHLNNNIRVKFQIVTPKTGEIKVCEATFVVDLNNHSDRVSYSCSTATDSAGASVIVSEQSPIANVLFVDENGSEIQNLTDETEGYIALRSYGNNIAITDLYDSTDPDKNGFVSKFGLNNIFTFDKEDPARTLSVTKELQNDSSRLGLANLSKTEKVSKENIENGAKSLLRIQFDQMNVNVQDGGTLTIVLPAELGGNQMFRFRDVPVNDSDIKTDGDTDVLVDNIVKSFSKNNEFTKRFSSILEFSRANGGILEMRSKFGGVLANAISFYWNLDSGFVLSPTAKNLAPGAAAANEVGNALMAGGTSAKTTEAIDSVAYETYSALKNGVDAILKSLESRMSFDSYGDQVIRVNILQLSNMEIERYKATMQNFSQNTEASKIALEDMESKFNGNVDPHADYSDFMRLTNYKIFMQRVNSMILEHNKRMIDLLS